MAVAMEGAEGKEKRVELFVGDRRSAEDEERTENREGGSADMRECVNPDTDRRERFVVVVPQDITVKRSVTSSSMNSPASSPVPRPSEFQAHIYNSFLQGRTSDVAVRIRASWDAIYNFHRVVLIQAVCTPSPSAPALSSLTSLRGILPRSFHRRVCRVRE